MLQLEAVKSPLVFAIMAASYALPAMGQTETKPAPQTGTVYVYRIKVRLVARAVHPLIYFDDTALRQPCGTAGPTTPICTIHLATGEYVAHELPAGKHMISTDFAEASQLFEVEPGKEYFFKLDHNNLLKHRKPMTLALVPTEQAWREMEGLRKR
jgi:hypothetical protein